MINKKNLAMFAYMILSTASALPRESLDQLAIRFETDKSSLTHNYTKVYEKYFEPFRDKQLKFLEIGFASGASAHMWQDYFTQAMLHFMDIDPKCIEICKSFLSKRVSCFLADQGDKMQLMRFIKEVGGDFDIIVDDGGHTMKQQITSFEVLFPCLKSGGIYVIEDLHTSYWKDFGGYGSAKDPLAGPGTTIRFLQNLVDDINSRGAFGYQVTNLNFYTQHIQAISFYPSLCVIVKN